MPNKLRALSGDEIISIFQKFSFKASFSKGSHFKLVRIIKQEKQIIVVPRHNQVAKGTIKSIYNKALAYIPKERLKPYFYTE